jgi:hypothetical protein
LLILDFAVCVAWMVHQFRLFQHPSLVGFTFIAAMLQYGLMAVSYGQSPELPFRLPEEYPYFLGATFTFYVIGASVAASIARFSIPDEQRRFFGASLGSAAVNVPRYVVIFVATLALGLLFVGSTEQTGIEMLVTHGGEQALLRRFRNEFRESNPYSYAGFVITYVIGPMLMMMAINVWRRERKPAWAAAAAVMLGLLVVTSTASLAKAPIVVLMLYVLANQFLSNWGGKQIRIVQVAVPAVLVLGLGALGYALTYGHGPAEAFEDTIDRIFVIPLMCVHAYLYVYPNVVDFEHGMGIGLVAKLLDTPAYTSPAAVVGYAVTHSNSTSEAIWSTDLWANFGWPGVIIGSAAIGALMVSLDRWCLLRPRGPATIALYAFFLVSSIHVAEVTIFTMLLSRGLIIAPLLAWLLEAGLASPGQARESIGGRRVNPPRSAPLLSRR